MIFSASIGHSTQCLSACCIHCVQIEAEAQRLLAAQKRAEEIYAATHGGATPADTQAQGSSPAEKKSLFAREYGALDDEDEVAGELYWKKLLPKVRTYI